MRSVVALVSLVAASAHAQAIDGTLSVTFEGWKDGYAVPLVKQSLQLTCSLTCPPSAPTLTYRVTGDTSSYLVSAPTEAVGRFGSGWGTDPNGNNVHVSEQYEPGIAFTSVNKSVSCHCGGRIGEGGFKDITSATTVIPAFVFVGTSKAKVGFEWSQMINARIRGSETVEVTFSGGGLDKTVTLAPADFGTQKIATIPVTPTVAGMMTVTAKFQPYGATHSNVVEVQPGESGAGGGSGGSGGSGGGGGEEPLPEGCNSTGGLLPLLALISLGRCAAARRR